MIYTKMCFLRGRDTLQVDLWFSPSVLTNESAEHFKITFGYIHETRV